MSKGIHILARIRKQMVQYGHCRNKCMTRSAKIYKFFLQKVDNTNKFCETLLKLIDNVQLAMT